MKKATLLLAVFATLLFNSSFAQVTEKGGTSSSDKKGDKKEKVQSEMSNDAASMAKEWTEKMKEVCGFNAATEKKVMEINLRYANKLEELKTKYKGMENPNSEAAKAEKDELTKSRLQEYSNVLSKEEMQKFKTYRDSMKKEDGDKAGKKDDVKEKYKNATPEEQERMKEEMKEKKEKKSAE